jgi:hypothetical protein
MYLQTRRVSPSIIQISKIYLPRVEPLNEPTLRGILVERRPLLSTLVRAPKQGRSSHRSFCAARGNP